MARIVKRSVAPIYLGGLVWLAYAVLFPLYRVSDYIICGVISAAFFLLGKTIWPDAVLIEDGEEPPAAPRSAPKAEEEPAADPEVAALLAERDKAVAELRRLNDAIADERISAQIDHLEETTRKIVDQVAAQPDKLPRIRRFLNYYLPTALKILNAYDRMADTGLSGGNVGAGMEKVERMMDALTAAFDKQLDELFGGEALDLSAELTVLEQMLAREGLGGSGTDADRKDPGGVHLEL